MSYTKSICLIAAFTLLMLSSCKPVHDLAYFEDLSTSRSGQLQGARESLRLQPGDELAISVNSEIPAASAHFNLPINESIGSTDVEISSSNKRLTYKVDESGDIDFPGIGKITVGGMTTMQLKNYLYDRISKEVKDPVVTVNIVNFRVNVLGEVNSPKVVESKNERLTILEALAACQDLTIYGKRDGIIVIREQADGKIEYGKVDINNSAITQSPYYYLQQNDVIYVTPNDIRQDNSKYNQNNSYKLTVLSTVISGLSVIASLVIALTVK